jgi:hypothetical protein
MAILKKYSKGRVTDTAQVKAESETPTAHFKIIPSSKGKAYKDAVQLIEGKNKIRSKTGGNGTTL